MNNLSIRNQISGTVETVTAGTVMATVRARLGGGQEIVAAVTLEAVRELGLDVGSAVTALIKSTEVSLATAPVHGISIRNQIPGTVASVAAGGAMATVKVVVNGDELTAAITRDAVEDLKLAPGTPVVALFKATEVSLAAA